MSADADDIAAARKTLAEARDAHIAARRRLSEAQWALAMLLWPHDLEDQTPCAFSDWKPWRACRACGLDEGTCDTPCPVAMDGHAVSDL